MKKYLVNDNVQSNVRGYFLLQYLTPLSTTLHTQNKQPGQQSWVPPLREYSHAYSHKPVSPFVASQFIDLEEPAVREKEMKETMAGKKECYFR